MRVKGYVNAQNVLDYNQDNLGVMGFSDTHTFSVKQESGEWKHYDLHNGWVHYKLPQGSVTRFVLSAENKPLVLIQKYKQNTRLISLDPDVTQDSKGHLFMPYSLKDIFLSIYYPQDMYDKLWDKLQSDIAKAPDGPMLSQIVAEIPKPFYLSELDERPNDGVRLSWDTTPEGFRSYLCVEKGDISFGNHPNTSEQLQLRIMANITRGKYSGLKRNKKIPIDCTSARRLPVADKFNTDLELLYLLRESLI